MKSVRVIPMPSPVDVTLVAVVNDSLGQISIEGKSVDELLRNMIGAIRALSAENKQLREEMIAVKHRKYPNRGNGGRVRAANMTPERRSEIARMGALAKAAKHKSNNL